MKNIGLGILVLVFITGLLFVFSGNEDGWICQDGDWVKHGEPTIGKPNLPCWIEDDLKVFNQISGSCQISEGNWLAKQKECEEVDKTWCDGHQGDYSECESGCRHNHDPNVACTAQCVGVCSFPNLVNDFNSCVEAGNLIMESYPRQCRDPQSGQTFVENIGNIFEVEDLIQLNSVRPNDKISSPLTLEGKAKGTWYFEGDFPVILTDWDGRIIAEGYVTAQSDWMVEDFVQFKGNLKFAKPDFDKRGILILKKDNPSDLPEYDNALEIPILFK
ncbi:MAG: Gmad2 immunoglobulin-like domain-containing protein [Patescibacteria group bacterium]|nr:Gmad2 immunoglobulin-like domain-containing protein [Patescibacteria group bacterium]